MDLLLFVFKLFMRRSKTEGKLTVRKDAEAVSRSLSSF